MVSLSKTTPEPGLRAPIATKPQYAKVMPTCSSTRANSHTRVAFSSYCSSSAAASVGLFAHVLGLNHESVQILFGRCACVCAQVKHHTHPHSYIVICSLHTHSLAHTHCIFAPHKARARSYAPRSRQSILCVDRSARTGALQFGRGRQIYGAHTRGDINFTCVYVCV